MTSELRLRPDKNAGASAGLPHSVHSPKTKCHFQCRSNMSAHARHSRKQAGGSNTEISDFRNPLVFSCNKLKVEKRMIILDIAAHYKYFCHESAECQTIQCP